MKERLIFLGVCLFVICSIVGNHQVQTRANTFIDLYNASAPSKIATGEIIPTTYETAAEIPPTTYYYDIPLSIELQQFVFDNCRDLDPRLIFAVMYCESGFDKAAVNGSCIGIMQIKVRCHADRIKRLGADIYNVQDNIIVGIDILSEYIGKYGLHRGLIAYNCGENSKTMRYKTTSYSREVVAYMEGLK